MGAKEGFVTTPDGADAFPVLRVRARSLAFYSINEITLGGVDLIPFSVCGLSITSNPDDGVTRATITFEVVPDIEMPASVEKVGV